MNYIILISLFFIFSCESDADTKNSSSKLDDAKSEFSSGNYQDALNLFEDEIKDTPSSQAYSGRAFANLRLGNIDNALSDFTEAITMDSENLDALAGRSFIYMYQDDFSKAISDASSVLSKNSSYEFELDKNINNVDLYYTQAFSEYSNKNFSACYDAITAAGISLSFEKSSTTLSLELLSPLSDLLAMAKGN